MAGDAKVVGRTIDHDHGFLSLCRSLNNPWMNGVLEGEQYAQAG